MKMLPLAVTLTLGLAQPLAAQSQDEVVQGTLMQGWQQADGARIAALHLALAPHWKTYWRAPGETGIPPAFDWSGSQNLAAVTPLWPSPSVITLNGMESIGYLDDLVLPLQIQPRDPSQPVSLRLTADIGVCKDICMPARLVLQADLSGLGTADPQIEAALANRPISAQAAGVRKVSCAVEPIDDGLRLRSHIALPRQGQTETLVLEVADPAIWVADTVESRTGSVLTGDTDLVSEAAEPFVLNRALVTITVIGQDRSVEIQGCPAP